MINIRFFGTARLLLKTKSTTVENCATVKEALIKVAENANLPYSKMKKFLVYVNDENIEKLHGFRTKIKDGDEIMLLSPSSGG